MTVASTATDIAEIARGMASLAWPVVAALFLFLFRKDIGTLMSRIRRAKAVGVDLELDEALDVLQERTEAASERVRAEAQGSTGEDQRDQAALWSRTVGQVIDDAAKSPVAALIGLSAAIERESREVLSSSAGEEGPPAWSGSLLRQIERLDLSPGLREAAHEFRIVRNKIVHGQSASPEEALRAVDIGLELLNAIQRIPRQVHRIVAAGLPCFADPEGTVQHPFTAVLVSSTNSADPDSPEEGAFPTTEPERFPQPGEAVSWEWESGRVFPESWFRRPDGEIRYGWSEALEFKGRPLH
ncbi:MAG TPA: hypothetical protein VKA35_03575 [Solirubrobacterales bacterium]|nr:hypothetical protein [Solirubrobacterales bacterium]